jgi:hypothetical protein
MVLAEQSGHVLFYVENIGGKLIIKEMVKDSK